METQITKNIAELREIYHMAEQILSPVIVYESIQQTIRDVEITRVRNAIMIMEKLDSWGVNKEYNN